MTMTYVELRSTKKGTGHVSDSMTPRAQEEAEM